MADISKSTTFQISAMLAKWSRKTTPALKKKKLFQKKRNLYLQKLKNTQ